MKIIKKVISLALALIIVMNYSFETSAQITPNNIVEFVDNAGMLVRLELYQEEDKVIGKEYHNNELVVVNEMKK